MTEQQSDGDDARKVTDAEVANVIKKLKALEACWPKGLWLGGANSGLILADGHPEDGGKVIEIFKGIRSDGADWEWQDEVSESHRKSRKSK